MTTQLNLESAIIYDIECLPNCFLLSMECLYSNVASTWEISEYRNDAPQLRAWCNWLHDTQTPMLGFNSIGYDCPMLHHFYINPNATFADMYAKNQSIITSGDRFGHIIWDRDRFAPQIDLFKVHHFDNIAKTTSLKALEINMRSPNVRESKVPFGVPISREDIDGDLIPYNKWDVSETKKFAFHSMPAIDFRIGLIPQFGIDVLNYNDGKIGAKMLEQRLGDDLCYDRSSGRKRPRQTLRDRIPLKDIIFPYIKFNNPEFQRVLDFMRAQTLTPADIENPEDTKIKTKGVFTTLSANVGGLDFHFGTGGVHGSVTPQKIIATDEWLIRDIDVKALYPSIAIVNNLAPAHLGEKFSVEYKKIPVERAQYAKGTYGNASLKLASNVPWGQSNNQYSIFFDPLYAMTIPINGQLMLCMLAEWLTAVPTFALIQANTDGLTYRIHRDYLDQCKQIEKQWEQYTCLELEDAAYSRMWIRDVNNYIAEDTKGKYKLKGAYWTPDPLDYARSISEASPPCWYKDLSALIVTRAAVAAMTHSIDPETFIRSHSDPFDFMLRARATGGATLHLGGEPVQRTMRYYVARDGAPLVKVAPPAGPLGAYKRAPRVTKLEYDRAMQASGGEWVDGICTSNKSRYEMVTTNIEAGWKIADCCDASHFSFANVDYSYYVSEAKKLIIG